MDLGNHKVININVGCRQMNHRGPLVEDLAKYNRKYKWPDNRVKLYFPREVTKKWLTFVNRFEYDKSTVKKIFQKKGDVNKINLENIIW
jgi:hypothetical protein